MASHTRLKALFKKDPYLFMGLFCGIGLFRGFCGVGFDGEVGARKFKIGIGVEDEFFGGCVGFNGLVDALELRTGLREMMAAIQEFVEEFESDFFICGLEKLARIIGGCGDNFSGFGFEDSAEFDLGLIEWEDFAFLRIWKVLDFGADAIAEIGFLVVCGVLAIFDFMRGGVAKNVTAGENLAGKSAIQKGVATVRVVEGR